MLSNLKTELIFFKVSGAKFKALSSKNLNYEKIKHVIKDPLYKNSFFLILTSILGSCLGFVFWILAAKFYSQEDVGITTAIISLVSLLVLISRVGLDFSIIRFHPEGKGNVIFNTSVILTSLVVILLGMITFCTMDLFSNELAILKNPPVALLFLLSLVFGSLATSTASLFIAIRRTEYYFFQTVLNGLRIILIIPLAFLGSIGIFLSFGLSYILASSVSLIILANYGNVFKWEVDRSFLVKTFHFFTANYFSELLLMSPNLILPILVLHILGPEDTAYFYIAYSISSILFMIPGSISTSLLVEGSHGSDLKEKILKSLIAIIILLIPCIIFIYLYGGALLNLFGKGYLEAISLLKYMALSSIFVTFCYIYISIERVRKKVKGLICISIMIFTSLIILSYVLMIKYGVIGIGYAWLVGYGLCSLSIIYPLLRIQTNVSES